MTVIIWFPILIDVSDFRQSSATLEFSSGDTEMCLTIPIVDDDVAETLEEVFNVLIVPQPSTVNVIPGRTTSTVIIVDEDCKYKKKHTLWSYYLLFLTNDFGSFHIL